MALSTETNWDTFYNTLSREPHKMAKVMYLYLVETGFDQKEAQMEVYKHFDYNYASIIMQCYNFSGRNGRKFSGTKLGGVVTKEDIMAFVKAYPNGISDSSKPGSGIEMEDFLRERIAKRNAKSKNTIQTSPFAQNTYNNSFNDNFDFDDDDDDDYDDESVMEKVGNFFNSRKKTSVSNSQSNTYQSSTSSSKSSSSDDGVIVGIIGVVVLLVILALVFNWFGLRTLLATGLIKILTYGWVIGMVVLLIALFLDKFRPLEGRGIIVKGISYVATFVITRIIIVYAVAFLTKFQ